MHDEPHQDDDELELEPIDPEVLEHERRRAERRTRDAVASITQSVGTRPLGWYCRYAPSISTRQILIEEGGFLYDSDSYADDLPYWVGVGGQTHLIVPYTMVHNDAKILADDWHIRVQDLPRELVDGARGSIDELAQSDDLSSIERAKIIEVLRRENGNKSRAARTLGIDRRKLYRLVEKYSIE